MTELSGEERKAQAWKAYEEVKAPAWKAYEDECKRIDEEEVPEWVSQEHKELNPSCKMCNGTWESTDDENEEEQRKWWKVTKGDLAMVLVIIFMALIVVWVKTW